MASRQHSRHGRGKTRRVSARQRPSSVLRPQRAGIPLTAREHPATHGRTDNSSRAIAPHEFPARAHAISPTGTELHGIQNDQARTRRPRRRRARSPRDEPRGGLMCGIIGYTGERDAAPLLLDGLQRLEYRGYDSAGIAVMGDRLIEVARGAGKLSALRQAIEGAYPAGRTGVGHTRWATHGKPTTDNAHPHRDCSGDVVVVHNGIIENYLELRAELKERGHDLASETDTETLPHLVESYMDAGDDLLTAFRRTIARIRGAQAIVVMSAREPGRILAARVGNAGGVVVGYGRGEMFVASDLTALLPETQTVAFLADGEIACVDAGAVSYVALDGAPVAKSPQVVPFDPVSAARGAYKHFMLKEIMEQPQCVMDTFRGRAVFDPPGVELEDLRISDEVLRSVSRVVLIGMGTSMHAALVARTYFERIAGIPAEVDNSSEFRYRDALIGPDTLVISVAQSGETVDTLEAMADAARRGAP
ncbi:MAG: glutamine--fructose-6-phosphate transaminase (isomerizing), partial [Dehalococcoidia bacterium]